jgi:hypothetical protein
MVFATQRARPCQRRRGKHCGRHTADAIGIPEAAWRATLARAEVVVPERHADAHRGDWNRSCRSCPHTYRHSERDQSRGPSLPGCCSPPRSAVRPPRTPAAHDSTSPSAYTRRSALTRAAQTGLSCSVRLRAHVLRPLPRRDLRHVPLRTEASQTWPSPRNDRLGSRVVNLSRLQASPDVATRVLAPSEEALDTPLGPPASRPVPGVCYSALRRLPRRDSHPLEMNSVKRTMFRPPRHDAPPADAIPARPARHRRPHVL